MRAKTRCDGAASGGMTSNLGEDSHPGGNISSGAALATFVEDIPLTQTQGDAEM